MAQIATGVYEQYGTSSTGVGLWWYKYIPPGFPEGQKFPAVVAWHAGGYRSGDSVIPVPLSALSAAGFLCFGAEYRLAPPHLPMNEAPDGTHPPTGQNAVLDDGHYNEQTIDCAASMRAARNHPLCDGRVYAMGASAGAAHVAYLCGFGTPGDDAPDLGAIFSVGISNYADPNMWAINCADSDDTCPHIAVAGYLNITDPAPAAPVGADLTLATTASPTTGIYLGMPSLFVLISNKDSLGIPTATGIAMNSYNRDGSIGPFEGAVSNGLIPKLIAAGITESTENFPEANKYKVEVVPVTSHKHGFVYWNFVLDDGTGRSAGQAVIDWFTAGAVDTGGGAPVISTFAPTEGFAGLTPCVITGHNFSGVIAVRFAGVDAQSFQIDSDTQITAIPTSATLTGLISLRNPAGFVNSVDPFVILAPTPESVAAVIRTPILDYPVGGEPPEPPGPPTPPQGLLVTTGEGLGQARVSWVPPADTSGATLLDYVAILTGGSGTVPAIPGYATQCTLTGLDPETLYTFELRAVTTYGTSVVGGAVVQFTTDPLSPPTLKVAPRGVLCAFHVDPDGTVDHNPANFWSNPNLRGGRYRTGWANIQPDVADPTFYDWTDIDAYLAQCVTYNKIAGISVAMGIYSAPFIFADNRIRSYLEEGPDPGLMPLPWDQQYAAAVIEFNRQFAIRYDEHPQLRYFVLSGLGQITDTVLAITDNDVANLLELAQARGFDSIESAWLYAAQRVVNAAVHDLRHTSVVVSLGKPIPDRFNNGAGSTCLINITQFGLQFHNFGIMDTGLNGGSMAGTGGYISNVLIHDYSSVLATAGFQFGHPSINPLCDPTQVPPAVYDPELGFEHTLISGGNINGKYIECYPGDATSVDAAYIADIQAANIVMDGLP